MIRLSLLNVYFLLGSCYGTFQSMLLSQLESNVSLGISLGRCIVTVGSHFFDIHKDIIIIRYRKRVATEIHKFSTDLKRNKRWTFFSAEINFLPNIFHCFDKNYFLEIGSYEDAVIAFRIMKQLNCWNPNQNIFIFSSAIFANQTAQFLYLISLAHKQRLSNLVVMLPTEERRLNFQIYYWAAKDNEKCAKKSKYPHFFKCRFGKVSAFQEDQKNSSTCSLSVKAVVWPPFVLYKDWDTSKRSDLTPVNKQLLGGLEIELVDLVLKLLGIDVDYYASTKEDWGRSFFNGSTTKSMQEIATRKVDLVVGGFAMSISRYFLFETSIPYDEENVICCVPYLGQFNMLSTVLGTSSLNIYLSVYLMYILLTLFVWVIAQFSKGEHCIYKRGTSVFLYNFGALIGISVKFLPRTTQVRRVFIMLIIFEMFYMAFYQSFLTSVLSTQKFDQEIKTMDDILQRNMSIYQQQENHRYFEFHLSKMEKMMLERWINCKNITECLENVYRSKRSAICLGKSTKDYILRNNERLGRQPLYCFNHKIISYPVVMVMRKSLPYRNKINEIIGRIISSGLIKRWSSSIFYGRVNEFGEPKALSGILKFSHLKPIFILFGIGVCFACTALVVEKTYYTSQNLRKK